MSCSNLIICAVDGSPGLAEGVLASLTEHWSGGAAPTFQCLGPESFDRIVEHPVDAAILIAGEATTRAGIDPLLRILDEHGIPLLALCPTSGVNANPFAGCDAIIESLDEHPHRLCSILRGLLHGQRRVVQLQRELAFNERSHGGLRGEITRIHEELQLAAMVQQEFLPRTLPSLHGVTFGALWRPANYVSGDIYEVTRLDEDHVGVFIADAVGHGVPAALMTMVICRALHTKDVQGSSYRIVPPSEVLARLNADMIRRQNQSSRFATAAYATVNCRSRVLTLAGAGHPPPLLLHADGSVDAIETSGGLLGVFADEEYGQVEMELAVDDRLLLYSDGFELAFPRPEGNVYEQRLPTTQYLDEFRQLAALDDPSRMVEAIAGRINVQRGSLHPTDDVTFVCMHVGALGEIRARTSRSADARGHAVGVES